MRNDPHRHCTPYEQLLATLSCTTRHVSVKAAETTTVTLEVTLVFLMLLVLLLQTLLFHPCRHRYVTVESMTVTTAEKTTCCCQSSIFDSPDEVHRYKFDSPSRSYNSSRQQRHKPHEHQPCRHATCQLKGHIPAPPLPSPKKKNNNTTTMAATNYREPALVIGRSPVKMTGNEQPLAVALSGPLVRLKNDVCCCHASAAVGCDKCGWHRWHVTYLTVTTNFWWMICTRVLCCDRYCKRRILNVIAATASGSQTQCTWVTETVKADVDADWYGSAA